MAGNRLAATIGGRAYPYTYLEGTDLLTAVAGPVAKAWTSDALATRISDGVHTFKFDSYRRSSGVIAGGVTYDYLRNGASQRVTKRVSTGAVTHYVYDDDGHLIAELDKAGNTLLEHIWLGNQPVGVVKNNIVYYVFADHLNTPRLITDTTNQARWSWHSNPFGSTAANENPRGLGALPYNLRFPGQYHDLESGMHYNYFRDYDPQTGRYVQSDPIGINGGTNTYLYVRSNPTAQTDFFGLMGSRGPMAKLPPPTKECMEEELYDSYGPFGEFLVKEVSVFSMLPLEENIDQAPLTAMVKTAASMGGKVAAVKVLSKAGGTGLTVANRIKGVARVGGAPLMAFTSLANMMVASKCKCERVMEPNKRADRKWYREQLEKTTVPPGILPGFW